MALTRAKKVSTLSKIEDYLSKADTIAFTGYKSTSVKDLEEARRELRKSGIDYQIAKKTLIKIAVKKIYGIDLPNEIMDGPVGVAYGYSDSVSLCKVLAAIAKKKKTFILQGGVVDRKSVDKSVIIALSTMLSRPEMLAKFASMLKSPLYKFSTGINYGLNGFARALKAYSDKQS